MRSNAGSFFGVIIVIIEPHIVRFAIVISRLDVIVIGLVLLREDGAEFVRDISHNTSCISAIAFIDLLKKSIPIGYGRRGAKMPVRAMGIAAIASSPRGTL